MDQPLPLSQEFPTIDFPETGSFSYILGSDGNQSDVDGNRLMQNLDSAGHLQQINNLLAPAFDTSPGPTSVEPSLRDFAGSIEFDIDVNSLFQEKEKKKASWVCSHKLKKLFIKMDALLTLQFSWKHASVIPLFIRATPVYTSPDYAKVAVERCPTHRQAEIDKNGVSPIVEHVLRCTSESALYEINPLSGRYSVKMPVKREENVANFNVDFVYFFTCQTSCTSGMERRPIQVLFTIEDTHGNVCGRRIWGFKICACPKRDMSKELLDKEWIEDAESHDGKKRIQETQTKKTTNLSADEKLDKAYNELINIIPDENQAIARSLLSGRFLKFTNHPNPQAREAFMALLQ